MDARGGFSRSQSRIEDAPESASLDASVVVYFDRVVPHRVFIQNGDTFVGKYLIQLFQGKTHSTEFTSAHASPTSLSSMDQGASSYALEEENAETTEFLVPDEVFRGFIKPETAKSEDDNQFWDYQLLGEFDMERISAADYEHVLSLRSDKARKQFLHALFRKLNQKQTIADDENSLEKEMFSQYLDNDNEDAVETPYEIYTSLQHPNDYGRNDPRFAYLNDVNIVQLCSTDVVQTCGTILFDTFTSSEPSDIAFIGDIVQAIVPNFRIEPTMTPKSQHVLVISSLLTWALTKQLMDEDGSPKAINEKRLKKRNTHPDYEHVLELEKLCLALKSEVKKNKKFQMHILGSGIPYGLEENIFYHWFALSYKTENLIALPVINQGDNNVPTIYINELIKIVDYIVDNPSSVKKRYCIAVENETNTLKDIVKTLNQIFTRSEIVHSVTLEEFGTTYPEDLVFSSGQKKTALDLLSTHLPVQSNFVEKNGEELDLATGSFISNLRTRMNEFCKYHKLMPLKILIHGPRACGKSELARKLADYYGLKYLSPDDLVNSERKNLNERIQYYEHQIELQTMLKRRSVVSFVDENVAEEQSVGDQNQDVEELSQQIMTHMEELRELDQLRALEGAKNRKQRDAYEKKLSEVYVRLLKSKFVEWHGYVLDGWPDSYEACKLLFGKTEGEEAGDADENQDNEQDELNEKEKKSLETFESSLLPEIVVSLEGCKDLTNDHLSQLLMSKLHPDSEHEMNTSIRHLSASSFGISFTEDENNEDDLTYNPSGFFRFFNNIDTFPLVFDVDEKSIDDIFDSLLARLGRARTLLGEEFRRQLDERRESEAREFERLQADLSDKADRSKREESLRMEQWADMNNILHYERNVIQELHDMPLRHYLVKHVMPLVTRGMNEVTAVKPDSPMEYLAEYFFKENSEFKLSNAHHNDKAERFWKCLNFMKNKLKAD